MENKSLAKALGVLEALATNSRPLTAAQLGPQLKLTRPTVYRILGTLTLHEYVTRQPDGPFYRPSFKLLELGHQVLERTDLLDAARPTLRQLAAQFRETVHLAVEEGGASSTSTRWKVRARSARIRGRAGACRCIARPWESPCWPICPASGFGRS